MTPEGELLMPTPDGRDSTPGVDRAPGTDGPQRAPAQDEGMPSLDRPPFGAEIDASDRDRMPGSPGALAAGCTCSVLANAGYRSGLDPTPLIDPLCRARRFHNGGEPADSRPALGTR